MYIIDKFIDQISHKQLPLQDNVIRDRSLEAIRLYNPDPSNPNSEGNADATLAVDVIETTVRT